MGKASTGRNGAGLLGHLFVKIDPSRGHGTGLFKVISDDGDEFEVIPQNGGERFSIYKALTYRDTECIKCTADSHNKQKEKNARIGLNRKKGA